MPPTGLVRAFVVQWWTSGVLLLIWSVETAQRSLQAGRGHDPHVALLGLVEAVAAALFLVPRTMRVGAIGLLATFAIAFVAHLLRGEFHSSLLLYAAVVGFVAVHGPVPMAWLRLHAEARSRHDHHE
jgi:uncharacterized membrane protein YphA (DoxX/SURF4 family)